MKAQFKHARMAREVIFAGVAVLLDDALLFSVNEKKTHSMSYAEVYLTCPMTLLQRRCHRFSPT